MKSWLLRLHEKLWTEYNATTENKEPIFNVGV